MAGRSAWSANISPSRGAPQPAPAGVIDAPLGRHAVDREKIAIVAPTRGRRAVTHWRVIERFGTEASLIACRLETGRTHQIRVHLASIGHPLLGDRVYGQGFKSKAARLAPTAQAALKTLGRQALHAAALGFVHPVTGEPLHFERAPPRDMQALRAALAAEGRGVAPKRGSRRPRAAAASQSRRSAPGGIGSRLLTRWRRGGNVGKFRRWLRRDGFLADPEADRRIRREGEHDVGGVVGQRTAVPFGEAEHRRRADRVGKDVREEAVRDFLAIGLRVLGGSGRRHHAGDRFGDGLAIGREVVGRAPGVEAIAEIFVVLGETADGSSAGRCG